MSETGDRQKLVAILAADAAGYSQLVSLDAAGAVAALEAARETFRQETALRDGRVVDTAGDSVLAVFSTCAGAFGAALAIQRRLADAAAGLPDDRRMRHRIGLHLGDVIEKPDGTVYGDGVNIAARLQALVEPGGIAVSDALKNSLGVRAPAPLVDQGEKALKNLPTPVRWYRVLSPDARTEPARLRTSADLAALPSIALLPFRTVSTDQGEAILADGLRVDIQSALVKLSGLVLIGIGTTNAYRGKDVRSQQAAAEMGVRYLLEGSVQKSGERVRVSVSLVDGASGRILWTGHYDGVLTDALELQDAITERIVTSLDVRLVSGEPGRVWRKTLTQPRARDAFYRGMHDFMKGQKEANAAAREAFEEVARLVPETSLGPSWAAFTHWWDVVRGWSPEPRRSFEDAERWAERAIPMADADGQAHVAMAHIHLMRREHERALQRAEEAIALRPSCTNTNPHLGNIYYYCGRPAEAVDRIRQTLRLSPMHAPWVEVVLAASCKELKDWEAAGAAARQALRMKPDDIDARLVLVEVGGALRDRALVEQTVQEILSLRPGFTVSAWARTQPFQDPAVLERISDALRDAGLPK